MLPVMLAVNTLPSPSTLAASTNPVVADSSSNNLGRSEEEAGEAEEGEAKQGR